MTKSLPSRKKTEKLFSSYVTDDYLDLHCHMVAKAMEAYANKFGEDQELWYQAGLLHDIDYQKYPNQHPWKAVKEILKDYPQELVLAVKAHGPSITGKEPETKLERYLFATDELSGLLHAYSLMRPTGYQGMKPKSVKKKLKDKSFAAKINRDEIDKGLELIETEPAQHIAFLIKVFKEL